MHAAVDALAAVSVDPVPWARAQMAFTLAFHIILVPLGVSWAVMTLIANYRGIKHDDARRAAAGPAVVEVHGGHVRGRRRDRDGADASSSACCGRGSWASGARRSACPFAFEGFFFFTEAIFISIYIFGWRRLKPWAHFWTGVPIVVAGIFGSVSVVAANAWMNAPEGVTLDSAGKVVDVDPMGVIFNDAMPLMAAHMVVAAYLVGGFLVASVYAVGHAARPPRPLPPARLHHRVHASPRSRPRSRWASATRWPAGSTTTSR